MPPAGTLEVLGVTAMDSSVTPALNVAVTVSAALIVTVQDVEVTDVQFELNPANDEPGVTVAFNVTVTPVSKLTMQPSVDPL